MLDEKPTAKTCSQFDHDFYPKLDDYDLLDDEEVQKYQSLIGPLQLVKSLGRFDIQCTDMSTPTFHTALLIGHLCRLKRTYKYVMKVKNFKDRFRTQEPGFSDLESVHEEWTSI